MGRKFIVEEVEEKSGFGCGSLIAIGVILLIIWLCSGFRSCGEDKAPVPADIKTEQSVQSDIKAAPEPTYTPSSPRSTPSTAASAPPSKPQKGASNGLKSNQALERDTEDVEPHSIVDNDNQSSITAAETESEVPAMTEKELRKAKRQAKREARRREKAEKTD